MLQASFKCKMPRLELKSWQTFLAIIRCQRTKFRKVIKLARSSKKSGSIYYGTIAVKLFNGFLDCCISAIFEFSGNEFELGKNKIEREREPIIFLI